MRPALLLLLLLAPLAAAGTEAEPDFTSPRGKRDASGDVLAAWLEPTEKGLKVTFKVARLESREQDLVFALAFAHDGRARVPAVGFLSNGRLATDSGANPSGWGGSRPSVDNKLLDAEARRGAPGYVSAVVPWGLWTGFSEGEELRLNSAYSSLCCEPGATSWSAPYDVASPTRRTFVAEVGIASPAAPQERFVLTPLIVPAWVIPLVVAGLTVAGAAGGWWFARRAR